MAETFEKSLAVVVGINAYANGISPLRSAVNDACEVARILERDHKYTVHRFLDQEASLASLRAFLTETLPKDVGPKDRLLVYFAGHGVALDGDDGPAGYVVPQDARADDPATLLPMGELSDTLSDLACRHLLLILDCCFAGAFRWTSTRDVRLAPKVLYQERFACFVADPARQVLTSAGSQQRASDVERRFGGRCDDGGANPLPTPPVPTPLASAPVAHIPRLRWPSPGRCTARPTTRWPGPTDGPRRVMALLPPPSCTCTCATRSSCPASKARSARRPACGPCRNMPRASTSFSCPASAHNWSPRPHCGPRTTPTVGCNPTPPRTRTSSSAALRSSRSF